jgi:hypothetical protein
MFASLLLVWLHTPKLAVSSNMTLEAFFVVVVLQNQDHESQNPSSDQYHNFGRHFSFAPLSRIALWAFRSWQSFLHHDEQLHGMDHTFWD